MSVENSFILSNFNSRKNLIKIFLLLFLIGIVFVWRIFSGYSDSSTVKKEHYLLRFNLNELEPGEVRIVHQNGLPVVLMHRTEQELKELLAIRSSLSDPDSKNSRQPKFAQNYHRSLKPEFFIAYAIIPGLGHEVNYRLKSYNSNRISDMQWYGGFSEERHSGAFYDKAGRIYKQGSTNLEVPNYKLTPQNQLYVYTLKELDFD